MGNLESELVHWLRLSKGRRNSQATSDVW